MKTLNDVYDIAELNNVTVACFDLENIESMSYMTPSGNCYIGIDPMKLHSTIDEKAKLIHELGHCVLGAFYNRYSKLDIRGRHEVRANRWAFKQLVPRDELMEAIVSGYREQWELAEYFDVPECMIKDAIEYYRFNS